MPTLCLPIVCSLPTRGYSQLFVFSMRCSLTTPPFMQVLPVKRRNGCGIGARYCEALCAAMMTQFLYILSCSFRLGVVAVGRNCARASCATWCGDTRGLCAQQWFGWVTNVFDYRSNGAALCCAVSHRQRCGHPLPIVVAYARVVAEPCAWAGQHEWQGATGLRFTLHGQSAPSCAHCCVRMCIRCTRLPI